MTAQSVCALDAVSLEEIFRELERVTVAYRNAKGRQIFARFLTLFVPKSRRIRMKERAFNDHLTRHLVLTAKTMPQFSFIHCEPKEMHFCNLRKGAFGARSLALICLNKRYFDDVVMPSVLSHETAHALGGIFFDEPLATLLGWEVDAWMVRTGYRVHRTSLYRCVRDVLFHVSYLKAKSIDRLEEWKRFIARLFRNEFTKNEIEEEMKHFEDAKEGLFGNSLSDYTLLPYLAAKNAAKGQSTRAVIVYITSNPADRQEVEVPEFIRMWNELMS